MSMRFISIIASKARRARARSGSPSSADELARDDLPGNPEAILHPAALLGFGHRRERVGEAVDLGLGLHGYLEGDRLVELELRSAIQAGERPTHQRELDHQHVPALPDG